MDAPQVSGVTVFVGRERELAALVARLDAAQQGQGGVALVAGEPGIGKTALCRQFAARVVERGGRALTGHCYEPGSLSLPYLPFIEALRDYALAREPEALRTELGSGATDVARIVPELRERTEMDAAPAEPVDREAARYRLLQAVSSLLIHAAAAQPLVLILEDLHDADQGTLDLLLHLARGLPGSRLLVAGTYRDVAVDRAHPLSAALAELRRAGPIERLHLHGLGIDEVQRLTEAVAGRALPSGVAVAVHARTEGNPLFAQEMARHLLAERPTNGNVTRWLDVASLAVPEGLRDVIGRRLSRLSPASSRLLEVAAVAGREFRLDVVQAVAGIADDDLEAVLHEVLRAAVVEERAATGPMVTYWFTHALFRQTLYEELLAPRRIRLHQQVARALEAAYATRLGEHAAELAEHFAHSSDPADLAKAVSYGELAALRASAVFAYGEAVRLFKQALDVQALLDANDRARRFDLLLGLGEAQRRAGEIDAALATFQQAVSVARAMASPHALGRAALGYEDAALLGGLPRQPIGDPSILLLQEALHGLKDAPRSRATARLRAQLCAGLARAAYFAGDRAAAEQHSRWTVTLARRTGDAGTLAHALSARHLALSGPDNLSERLTVATELVRVATTAGAVELALGGRQWRINALLESGNITSIESEIAEFSAQAEQFQLAALRWYVPLFRAMLALLQGRYAEAAALTNQAQTLGEQAHSHNVDLLVSVQRYLLHREQGRLPEIEEEVRELVARYPSIIGWQGIHMLVCAETGREAEARAMFERLAVDGFAAIPRDHLWLANLTFSVEVCTRFGDARRAEALYRLLEPYAQQCIVASGVTCWGSVAHYLGLLAATAGQPQDSARHFQTAITTHERLGWLPMLAYSRAAYAASLLCRTDDLALVRDQLAQAERVAEHPAMVRLRDTIAAIRARLNTNGGKRPAASPLTSPHPLTPREVDVLRLIAAGLTTRQIASTLVVSVPTIETHITNIYGKIHARGRADATAYALRHGLAEVASPPGSP